jgi:hypothetical protein
LTGNRIGETYIDFADGVQYVIPNCPPMEIRNIVAGQQYQLFNGKSTIEDHTNKLCAELNYAPCESGSMMESFKKAFKGNFFGKKSQKDATARPKRADDIAINIYQRAENG